VSDNEQRMIENFEAVWKTLESRGIYSVEELVPTFFTILKSVRDQMGDHKEAFDKTLHDAIDMFDSLDADSE